MSRLFPLIVLAGRFLSGATEIPSLEQWVLSHHLEVSPYPRQAPDSPIYILAEVTSPAQSKLVKREYLMALFRERLKSHHIQSQIVTRDYVKMAESSSGTTDDPIHLFPKAIVEVHLEKMPFGSYRMECRLSFIYYQIEKPPVLSPKKTWGGEFQLSDLSQNELEERLSQFLRREIDKFAKAYKMKNVRHSFAEPPKKVTIRFVKRSYSDIVASGGVLPVLPTVSGLQLGATVGTPARLNLNVAWWGVGKLPIVLGGSGMYFDRKTRGAQADLGWLVDREGSFQQAIGLSAAGFNESSTSLEVRPNLNGSAQKEEVTLDRLRLYWGPTYTLQWGSLRLQTGVAWRAQESGGTHSRFLFQLGFVPRVWF